jgi:outer membrane protein insertion porin family
LGDFIFTLSGEGGYIHPLENRSTTPGDGIDDVRLTDRFFLGEPQIRGFDIRGVGPRVVRSTTIPGLDENGNPINEIVEATNGRQTDDAIGGRAYYLGRAELEIPLGSGARELGLRPSIFVDIGAVFKVKQPLLLTDLQTQRQRTIFDDDGNPIGVAPEFLTVDAEGNATVTLDAVDADGNPNPIATNFVERFFGDSPSPRVSVGFGVNWNSPFGPFRIDIAKALLKEPGDDTKLFTFNVGTQF